VELKSKVEHYKVDFPILILRIRVAIDKETAARLQKMELQPADLLKVRMNKNDWVKKTVSIF